MLTSKQRAKLRGLANTMNAIFQVGKEGMSDALTLQIDDVLRARELVKLRVLETAPQSVKEIANELAKATCSEVVQVIGSRFVLYRRNSEAPIIELVD